MRTAFRLALLLLLPAGLVRADGLVCEPILPLDDHIFPSYVIATSKLIPEATLPWNKTDRWESWPASREVVARDAERLLPERLPPGFGLLMQTEQPGRLLTIRIKGGKYLGETTAYARLPEAGTPYAVWPKINYNYEELSRVRQPTVESTRIQVLADDTLLYDRAFDVPIAAVGDCVFLAAASTERLCSLRYLFSCYVNENSPEIDRILRRALDTRIISETASYQKPASEQMDEVFAIWYALEEMRFQYSNITTPSGGGVFNVARQNVRLVGDSTATGQANCVDGTVLIASVLHRLGYQVDLVNVPGHMFLSFCLQTGRKRVTEDGATSTEPQYQRYYLETTMMGQAHLAHYLDQRDPVQSIISDLTGQKTRLQVARKVFDRALQAGQRNVDVAKARAAAAGNPEIGPHLINVERARAAGLPAIGG